MRKAVSRRSKSVAGASPIIRSRQSDLEDAIVALAEEFRAFGQVRAANELRQRGFHISPGGVRCVWLRHGLETFKKRLSRLEAKSAEEGTVFTGAQVLALERGRQARESDPESIETHHPGYLVSQDTMYVGYIKGDGRFRRKRAITGPCSKKRALSL